MDAPREEYVDLVSSHDRTLLPLAEMLVELVFVEISNVNTS